MCVCGSVEQSAEILCVVWPNQERDSNMSRTFEKFDMYNEFCWGTVYCDLGERNFWCCGGTCLDSINHKESSGGKYMETSVCRCKRRTVVMGRDREDMDTGSGIWMVDVSGT